MAHVSSQLCTRYSCARGAAQQQQQLHGAAARGAAARARGMRTAASASPLRTWVLK